MTCIAAIAHEGKVWMGGDSMCTSGDSTRIDKNSKVWTKERDGTTWVFGVMGSARFSQILQVHVELPEIPISESDEVRDYIVRNWVPQVQQVLSEAGNLIIKDNLQKTDSAVLIGVSGRLFRMDGMFYVSEPEENFCAIGSGGQFAIGYLLALEEMKSELPPKERIDLAISAAESHCVGVGGRHDILCA